MNDALNSNNNSNEEKRDDVSVDKYEHEMIDLGYDLIVPSFVRLFVIRRIVAKYIIDSNKTQVRKNH